MPARNDSARTTSVHHRLAALFTPRASTDWRRLVALVVLLLGVMVVVRVVIALITGNGPGDISSGTRSFVLAYLVLGASWWRLCYLEIGDRPDGDPIARRAIIRGGLVWYAISVGLATAALVIVVATEPDTDGRDGNSAGLLALGLLFILGVAFFSTLIIAGVGRAWASWNPRQS